MEKDSEFYNKLFEILAALQYNSERREILEEVLKNFLVKKDLDMDIVAEARKILTKRREQKGENVRSEKEIFKSEWFKQECLLLSNIPHQYIPEYIIQKFSPFSEEFEKRYGFEMNSLWLFAFKLLEYVEFKKHATRFTDEVYKFRTKNEYADLGFVAIPTKIHTEKWKNIITLSVPEIKRVLSGTLGTHEIEEVLRTISINQNSLPEDANSIRFSSTPILRTSDDTLILLAPWYLTRALPSTYESLFKKCKSYLESKGKSFEKLVQTGLKRLPFETLAFNVGYGDNFEVDAIIKFKKSVWFSEVSSHPPSLKSLKGDPTSIKRDLRIAIKKCIKQGKRCLKYIDEEPLSCLSGNAKNNGILIIIDGVYPQLNMNTHITFFEEKTPIYIINWFDFITLLNQPEVARFEDFLLWRTQQPMPIICFDEKDYWAFYFDRYEPDERVKNAFEIAKEKLIRAFYISYRFNAKEYLEKLVGD